MESNKSNPLRMKILYITVRSDFGGGPRHVGQLIDNMPNDMDIYMAYPKGGDPYGKIWDNCSSIKGVCHIPYRKFSIKSLFELRKIVITNKIDIVHSHGNGGGLYSRMLKLLGCKIKVVHTFHGITDNYTNRLKGLANKISGKILKHLTDSFILVSKGELDIGIRLNVLARERSYVIYNGIAIPPAHDDRECKNTFDIVSLSRFDYQKNMDLSLEIARIFKENKDIRFVWVGNGTDYERLKAKSEKERLNIVFTGFSKEPYKYLESSDIYLSSSRFEGLPYALIEAASVGLPIIATDVVGNNEVVVNGKTGYLYTTVEDAVSKITYLFDNPSIRRCMSKESENFFRQNFTIGKMIDSLVTVYKELFK